MNIFYTNRDPNTAAREHCDKHVVKMIVEYAQLLSTAHHVIDGDAARPGIYRVTHKNHPSAVWVRQSAEHYGYVSTLLEALGEEYFHRYGRVHKTMREVAPALILQPENMPMDGGWIDPPQCMPDEYKRPSVVAAYRAYVAGAKRHFAKWTNRTAPSWF